MRTIRFFFVFVIAFAAFDFAVVYSQGLPEDPSRAEFRAKLPALLAGNTNAGTEFYFSFPPCYEVAAAGNSVRVYVSSGVRTLVTVEVPGRGFIQRKYTIPNDIIDFEIPPAIGQPFQKDPMDPPPPDQVWREAGVHVYADDPIIVYGVTRFNYTSDGFLAIPVSALGKEYRIASYADMSAMYSGYELPSETTVTAAFDGTIVTFEVGGNLLTRTASGWKPGDRKTFVMQKGDVLAVSTITKEGDLSGSRVIANKPVAVVSGNQCANVPTYIRWCDFIVEMELPVHTWGTAYHVTRIAGRQKNSFIKVFAKEPNTTVYVNGQAIGLIRKAWGMEGEAFLHQRVSEEPPGSFIVHADKPIYVMQYNTGQEDDNIPSDPFQLVLTPIEQFQTEIVFNTPGIKGTNKGFSRNYVNLVYELDSGDAIPDDLEFAVVNNGQFQWSKVKAIFGPFPGDIFPFPINGKRYASKILELPGDGVYRIRCSKPFAAYAYGFSNYDSYGFPTSVALADLSVPDTVAPDPSYTINCDTSEVVGEVRDLPEDPAVRSNLAKVVLDPEVSYNYILEVAPFVPGNDDRTTWQLRVEDLSRSAYGRIIFTDRAGNDTTVEFRYRPYLVEIQPKELDFGVLKRGEQKEMDAQVVNLSEESWVEVTMVQLQQGNQGFEIVNMPSLPVILPPKGQIPIRIRFTASAPGKYEDSAGHGNQCVFRYDAHMVAVVNEPRIEVSDADFGKVVVGQTARKSVTIYNNSDTRLEVKGYSGPSNAVFRIIGMGAGEFPKILEPKQRYTFEVEFAPQATQVYSDQIVFSNDARGVDSIAVLVGEGIAPGLLVQNYDWGRKRVYTGPYAGVIELENTGTADLLITRIGVRAGGDVSQFVLPNFATLVPMQLKAGEKRTIDVGFAPTLEGPQQVEVEFEYSKAGQPTVEVSRLTGIGIVPRLTTEDVDFGQMYIGDPAVQRTMRVVAPEGEYNDSVEVTGVQIQPVQAQAGEFWIAFGTVRRNGVAVSLPVVVQPGDVLEFEECYFEAQAAGQRTAEAIVQTGHPVYDQGLQEVDVISNWEGEGIAAGQIVVGQPNSPRICETETAEIQIPVSNTGNADFEITDIRIVGGDAGDFSIVTTPPVVVPAQGQVMIVVLFDPQQVGQRQAVIEIENTTLDNPVVQVTVSGVAELFSSGLAINSNQQRPIPSEEFEVQIGLTQPIDALAGVDRIRILMKYDGLLFEPDANRITVRAGAQIENVAVQIQKDGQCSFDIVFDQPGQVEAGELARVVFGVYLTTEKESEIVVEAEAVGNECVQIEPTGYVQQIGQVCALDVRAVLVESNTYNLSSPQPNPMGVRTEIEFSIPFDDQVWIGLYRADGELIQTIVDGQLKKGKYRIQLERQQLGAGVYFVRMRSGRYEATQQLIVE